MRLALAMLIATASLALAQEHHHPQQDAQVHNNFYLSWNRPNHRRPDGTRMASCCSMQDCFPSELKHERGFWWTRTKDGRSVVIVPEDILEHNQPDARDSPDFRNHVCIRANQVICAVLGSPT